MFVTGTTSPPSMCWAISSLVTPFLPSREEQSPLGGFHFPGREVRPDTQGLSSLPANVHDREMVHSSTSKRNGHAEPHLDPREN